MASIDAGELKKWERGDAKRCCIKRLLLWVRYKLAPALLGRPPSISVVILALVRLVFHLGLTLLPIGFKLFDSQTMSWTTAVVLSVGIFVAITFNYIYDKLIKDYKPKTERARLLQSFSLELAGTIGKFGPAVRVRKTEQMPIVDETRSRVLQCIRSVAQIHLGDYSGIYLQATLFVFDDAECKNMRIAARATPARPVGKVVPSEELMAYYVARSKKHRIVNDFLNDPHPFPRTGISDPSPPYRSILMIPLLDRFSGNADTCMGVVTIDSSRPYHFWPSDGNDLVVKLKPYCTFLLLILNLCDPHRMNYNP